MGYSINCPSATMCSVTVTPVSGYQYYRIIIRPSSSSTAIVDTWRQISDGSTKSYSFTGMTNGTSYTANVGYSTSNGGSCTFFGAQTFVQQSSGGGGGGGGSSVSVTGFTATQYGGAGSKQVSCSWSVSGANSSATWKLEAWGNGQWWTKASGQVSYGSSCIISVDEFKTYTLKVTVTSGGYSDSDTAGVTVEPLSPAVYLQIATHNSLTVATGNRSSGHDYGSTVTYYLAESYSAVYASPLMSGSAGVTSSYTFTGLSANKDYYVRMVLGSYVSVKMFRTAVAPEPEPEIRYFYGNQYSGTMAQFSWDYQNFGANPTYVLQVRNSGGSWVTLAQGQAAVKALTKDVSQYGSFDFRLTITDANGKTKTAACSVTLTRPDPTLDYFTVEAQTGRKAKCDWTIANNVSTTRVELRYSKTAPSSYQTGGTLEGSYPYGTLSHTISFTQAGTYYVWACLYNGNTYISAISKTVTIREERPDAWNWTGTESGAFAGHGSIKNLTMGRWNAFIERVNEAVTCCNGNLGSSISQVSSRMSTNRIMYATNFNEVRGRIDQLCTAAGVTGTGIGNAATGGVIFGSYFTSLSGALNRAINNM